MSRVIHFEIPARNIDAAREFYSTIFGWKIEKWGGPEDYYLVTTGEKDTPGIDGAIYKPGNGIEGVINTAGVDDLDLTIEKIKESGGEVITPKQQIPGVGWFCYAKDPEEILFGVMQSDPMPAS